MTVISTYNGMEEQSEYLGYLAPGYDNRANQGNDFDKESLLELCSKKI